MTGPGGIWDRSQKSASGHADELINRVLLRRAAGIIVLLLYKTPVTPNQVTIAAVLTGLASAWSYHFGTPAAFAWAGGLILFKDILDDADGQLARAKELYSRRGRFLDSIGDFIVSAAVFGGIAIGLGGGLPVALACLAALAGITLRVSYHTFYLVSFLHREDRYGLNRIVEEVTEEDKRGDPVAYALQRIFGVIYTWQDKLMLRIDLWCRGSRFDERLLPTWYADRTGLALSGLMGFGTEISILAVCSFFGDLPTYLTINLVAMNAVWMLSVVYRRLILARNLK